MTTFFIVRHGETLLNQLGRAQGWSDSPLTAKGIADAKELGRELRDIPFSGAYSSDTIRAKTTCELILSELKLGTVEIAEDYRLREWCLGSMDAELNAQFIRTLSDWLDEDFSIKDMNLRLPEIADAIFKNDETGMAQPFSEIEGRLTSALMDIAQDHEGENVLVVTHAFVMKTLLFLFASDKLHAIEKISNTDVFQLQCEDSVFHFL